MRNHSYENDFDLHENETACRTHFHKKGFALRLVLKQRHKGTRKWPVVTKSKALHHWSCRLQVLALCCQNDVKGRQVAGASCPLQQHDMLKPGDQILLHVSQLIIIVECLRALKFKVHQLQILM